MRWICRTFGLSGLCVVLSASLLVVACGWTDEAGTHEANAPDAEAGTDSAQSLPPYGVELLPQYEVIGREMLNDAMVVEVKTEAPVSRLGEVAEIIIADERTFSPFMVRVLFYFADEIPGAGLPRYRIEWTEAGTRVEDFSKRRKIAGLRF